MPVPQVVIVGRPNVGKSSLLNWLAGRRISIVDDQAGVTRDRVTYLMEHGNRFFELVDTGGIGIVDCDDLTKEIEGQIEQAIESADVILFVVDARAGIVPLDEEVARRLRYSEKPIILVANKVDAESLEPQADEFYRFGRGKMVKVSCLQNRNQDDLMRLILERLPAEELASAEPSDPVMKMAIVGRRNTGKSTFVNTLAQAERMIVSEIAGTTRDSVDVRFDLDGKTFIAIDTPGLRRSKSVRTDLDFYSTHRAQRSIRRADVSLLFFDCSQRLSKVDKQLCKYISDNYKPCIFVVNKWDKLYGQMPTEKWVEYLRESFSSMGHVPIAFITGQTGKNVKALLNHAMMLFKQSLERVSTAQLNKVVKAALDNHPPPMHGMLRPKIYFATQVSVQPPTLVLMCNEPQAFTPSYRRYLLTFFRDHLPFGETPIKVYLQKRVRAEEADRGGPERIQKPRKKASSDSVLDDDDDMETAFHHEDDFPLETGDYAGVEEIPYDDEQ